LEDEESPECGKELAFSTAHGISNAANIMNKAVVFGLGCLGIIILAVIVFGGAIVGGYNGLVRSSTGVDASWAQVQTQYQRRADLIPNLVRTVEGAANFEKSTLTDVINARASATKVTIDPSKAPTDPEQLRQYEQAQNALSGTLGRLLAVSENYPQLKANNNFRDLQAQIEGTENRIAVARRDFNNTVQGYNAQVRSFPAVIYAGWFGFQPKPYFQSSAGAEAAPSVNFPSFSPSPSPK
jgi:LemA protein